MRSPGARLSDQTRTRSDSDNSTCPTQPFIPLAANSRRNSAGQPSIAFDVSAAMVRPLSSALSGIIGWPERLSSATAAQVAGTCKCNIVPSTGRKGTMLEHVLCSAWLEEMLRDCIDPDRLGIEERFVTRC